MYWGDLKGMVAGKSVRMKTNEYECFVLDFPIFQMTNCPSPDE